MLVLAPSSPVATRTSPTVTVTPRMQCTWDCKCAHAYSRNLQLVQLNHTTNGQGNWRCGSCCWNLEPRWTRGYPPYESSTTVPWRVKKGSAGPLGTWWCFVSMYSSETHSHATCTGASILNASSLVGSKRLRVPSGNAHGRAPACCSGQQHGERPESGDSGGHPPANTMKTQHRYLETHLLRTSEDEAWMRTRMQMQKPQAPLTRPARRMRIRTPRAPPGPIRRTRAPQCPPRAPPPPWVAAVGVCRVSLLCACVRVCGYWRASCSPGVLGMSVASGWYAECGIWGFQLWVVFALTCVRDDFFFWLRGWRDLVCAYGCSLRPVCGLYLRSTPPLPGPGT